MTARRILILIVLALVGITGAVLLANQRSRSSQSTTDALYPTLKAQTENIKAIRIYKAGDARALEIIRNGAQWTLTERHGYPIASAKARNLVRSLSDANVLEEKTSDPAKYSALSVEDVNATGAKGVRIELEGAAVNLIVGKDGAGGKSSFVRRVGEAQSLLVDKQLSASPEATDWLDKDIINVSADRIQSASIAIEGAKPYTVAKTSRADADFKVEALPKGKSLSDPTAANSAASALMNLSLDDVQPKSSISTDKPNARAVYKTFDGLVVALEGYKQGDQHLIALTPSYDAALAEQFKVKTTTADAKSDQASKAAETTAATPTANKDVAAEVTTSAARVANWAYTIPQYKYDAIFRPIDELLKK